MNNPPSPENDADGDYSDIGEEFEENTYEGLSTEIVKPPDYSELGNIGKSENEIKKTGNDNDGKFRSDNYESLSFDTNDDNLYEELDTLKDSGITDDSVRATVIDNGGDVSNSATSQGGNRGEVVGDHFQEFPVDSFYLKKLDAVIQEIRFGIGKSHHFRKDWICKGF